MTAPRLTPRRPRWTLAPSSDSRGRAGKANARKRSRGEEGLALLIAMVTVAILSVMIADLHETTGTGYAVAISERDTLQAEYAARSGLSLMRLLMTQEPAIRGIVQQQMAAQYGFSRPLPQFPVWTVANALLRPFCNYGSMVAGADSAIDFMSAQGLADMPGTCQILAFPENSKINVNHALRRPDADSRLETSRQLFTLMGGYQSPSPYDPIFQRLDPDGQLSTRIDITSAIVDWWDLDTTRHAFDPGGGGRMSEGGSEDNPYTRFRDRYEIKNAPFDSFEELRLVRGVSDDFWANFIEPDAEDPRQRTITIYGIGAVNPNLAPGPVLVSRLCSFPEIATQALCIDPFEQQKLAELMRVVQQLPIPPFATPSDFVSFMRGQGELYPVLQMVLGQNNPLLFQPLTVAEDVAQRMMSAFVPRSQILTVQSTGVAGRTRVRIRAVVNFDPDYRPPVGVTPPMLPPGGVYFHYRID